MYAFTSYTHTEVEMAGSDPQAFQIYEVITFSATMAFLYPQELCICCTGGSCWFGQQTECIVIL